MKESMVLRDRYTNLKKKQSGDTAKQKEKNAKKAAQDNDRKNITRVVSGATAFMKSVHTDDTEQQKIPKAQPEKAPPPKEKKKPPTPIATPKEKQVPAAPIPTAVKKEIENAAKETEHKTGRKSKRRGNFC